MSLFSYPTSRCPHSENIYDVLLPHLSWLASAFSLPLFPPVSFTSIVPFNVVNIFQFMLLDKTAQPVLLNMWFVQYRYVSTVLYPGYAQYLGVAFNPTRILLLLSNLNCTHPLWLYVANVDQFTRTFPYTLHVSQRLHWHFTPMQKLRCSIASWRKLFAQVLKTLI